MFSYGLDDKGVIPAKVGNILGVSRATEYEILKGRLSYGTSLEKQASTYRSVI
jgi:hypothetical protein